MRPRSSILLQLSKRQDKDCANIRAGESQYLLACTIEPESRPGKRECSGWVYVVCCLFHVVVKCVCFMLLHVIHGAFMELRCCTTFLDPSSGLFVLRPSGLRLT